MASPRCRRSSASPTLDLNGSELVLEPFGRRLRAHLDTYGPLCVGIDPHPGLLRGWGLADDVAGLERFTATCVEALAGRVAVVKPQSAFFERHGSAGIAVLERAVRDLRAGGTLVLLDAKRGDIGSTMQGYADAYLDQTSPLAVDAITVNPYLGFESLRPVLDTAAGNGAGVFVVTLTSNPEGSEVQRARNGTRTVAGHVLGAIRVENARRPGGGPMGSVGAVVGATLTTADEDLRIEGPLLAPGFGAQGGTADEMAGLFAGVTSFVVPSSSRDVLSAGPSVDGIRAASARAQAQVRAAFGADRESR